MSPLINIDCPHCHAPIRQEVREITVRGTRACPFCTGQIQFSGGFLIRVLRKMEKTRTSSDIHRQWQSF